MFSNAAFLDGLSRLSWWKDWRQEYVAIVASGPSAKSADLQSLKGKVRIIAIKRNIELCPWADVVYGCDKAWWRSVHGLPDFAGLKLCWDDDIAHSFPSVRKLNIKGHDDSPKEKIDRVLFNEAAVIGNGGNSGFQALNIALQFWPRGIALIGFDMTDRSGAHWYGRNEWPMANNPSQDNFRRWIAAFNSVPGDIAPSGIDVVNVSPTSVMKCFKRQTLTETLNGWGL